MEELIDLKLNEYINEVDSKKASPGGGSVAALVGALGVSLARMSAHFSFDKRKYKEASKLKQDKYLLAFKELALYKDNLMRGVDDDALSYNEVCKAIASKDKEKIQIVLNYSADVAFEMIQNACNAMFYVSKLVELGNQNLYSDLISGAILLDACANMAFLNVKANVLMIEDDEIKEKYVVDSNDLIKQTAKLKKKILKDIENK